MSGTYKLVESVGSKLIPVTSYDDSHIHHPSRNAKGLQTGQDKDFEAGRDHARLDGEYEEVRYLNGETFVKKDMIFLENGSGNALVPSPVKGYVYFDKSDGQANIYDAPKPDGTMVARVFHLKPETFAGKSGDLIEYGQPLGTQGQTGKDGKPDPKNYGIHAHVEFNVKHLDQFKQYISDINSGVIAPNKYPSKTPDQHYNGSQLEPVSPQSSIAPATTRANGDQSYKDAVLTKTTAAIHDLCDARGYPNHGGRDNMACHFANDLITQGAQGKGQYQAALHTDGKTISVREQISEFNSYTATADSNAIVNIPKADSLAKIAAYEAPVLAQNNPTHEQEISRGRSL